MTTTPLSATEAANLETQRELIVLGIHNLGKQLAQAGEPAMIENAMEALRKLAALRDSLPPKE
jgi:hypothetical protein